MKRRIFRRTYFRLFNLCLVQTHLGLLLMAQVKKLITLPQTGLPQHLGYVNGLTLQNEIFCEDHFEVQLEHF